MTTHDHAQRFINAHIEGFIPSLSKFANPEDNTTEICNGNCKRCPADCGILSTYNNNYDFATFRNNYKPIAEYIQQHHPEYLI